MRRSALFKSSIDTVSHKDKGKAFVATCIVCQDLEIGSHKELEAHAYRVKNTLKPSKYRQPKTVLLPNSNNRARLTAQYSQELSQTNASLYIVAHCTSTDTIGTIDRSIEFNAGQLADLLHSEFGDSLTSLHHIVMLSCNSGLVFPGKAHSFSERLAIALRKKYLCMSTDVSGVIGFVGELEKSSPHTYVSETYGPSLHKHRIYRADQSMVTYHGNGDISPPNLTLKPKIA